MPAFKIGQEFQIFGVVYKIINVYTDMDGHALYKLFSTVLSPLDELSIRYENDVSLGLFYKKYPLALDKTPDSP